MHYMHGMHSMHYITLPCVALHCVTYMHMCMPGMPGMPCTARMTRMERTHTCIHAYMHTYVYMYIHIDVPVLSPGHISSKGNLQYFSISGAVPGPQCLARCLALAAGGGPAGLQRGAAAVPLAASGGRDEVPGHGI